ncbi:PDZ domain-containing protein [Rothia nasisuis]|uniref:PDZ domain-containing protein n=1 Tax=Rothia nasisuis TaxID=2109647 RepID=UPI003AFA73FC
MAVGDIIMEMNGKPVIGVHQLMNEIATLKPEASLSLTVLRAGKPTEIKVTLGKRP